MRGESNIFIQLLPLMITIVVIYAITHMVQKKNRARYGDKKLIGIGGWLLFFIITNTIGLLRTIIDVLPIVRMTKGMPQFDYGIYALCLFYIIYLCYAVYSIYILARVHEFAIRNIKRFIIFVPFFLSISHLISPLVWSITIDAYYINSDIMHELYDTETLMAIVMTCVYSAIWYRYFCVSRRVQNTWAVHTEGFGSDVFE